MPNNTTNQLRVTGPEDSIANMQAFAKGTVETLACQAIIPMPVELKGTDKGSGQANNETLEETHKREQHEAKLVEQFGFDNWYDWCWENWGTKWGVYDCSEWTNECTGLYLTFQSAWSPPLPVIAELARRFPDLTISIDYSDEGGGFAGRNIYKGEVCEENFIDTPALVEAKNRDMGLPGWNE